MNARERIAEILDVHQLEFIDWEVGWDCGCNERGDLAGMPFRVNGLRHQADAVLTVLPDLLTDADIINAVAWDLDPVDGLPDTRHSLRTALMTAAKALTGGEL